MASDDPKHDVALLDELTSVFLSLQKNQSGLTLAHRMEILNAYASIKAAERGRAAVHLQGIVPQRTEPLLTGVKVTKGG